MAFKFLRRLQESKLDFLGLKSVVLSSAVVMGFLLGVRWLGLLQSPELIAFDRMAQLRPDEGLDSRLLIVGVTEADIKRYGTPLSDQYLANLLQKLQRYQPRVIGVDIFRDIPQGSGYKALTREFQAKNIIAITKIGGTQSDPTIAPPPSISLDQVGFNDVVTDADGVVRRSLLFADTPEGNSLQSFSFLLAQSYLAAEDLIPTNDAEQPNYIRWGKTLFQPLESDSGAYQHNDAAGYQILLNYRNRKQISSQVTLADVLEGKIDPKLVKDKIVLIGSVAPSSRDFFFTPYSAVNQTNPKMWGVVVHAQMVSQILDAVAGERPLFWFWSEWIELLWIGGWTVVGATLAWCIRNPLWLGTSAMGSLGLLAVAGYQIFLAQGWVPIVTPALSLVLTGGVVVAYRAQQAQRQQQMTMTLLGQNASPEIAAALWNSRDRLMEDGKLPGQKLVATMLFTDIKDFSTISEQMQPEDLLNWLNEYLGVMTKEVQAHQGIVNKFTGDGLIAVFGVPVARQTTDEIAEDARHAVSCAISMGENLKKLNQEWQKRNLPCIQIRVGIFTGPIVAGSLGGKERMEYGIIGDSVNTASRLESCEKERHLGLCRILTARETLVHIENQFQVERWGLLPLKGKQHLVDVYRVVGYQCDFNQEQTAKQTESGLKEQLPSEPDNKSSPLNPKSGKA